MEGGGGINSSDLGMPKRHISREEETPGVQGKIWMVDINFGVISM